MAPSQLDSRHYIIAYELRSKGEIPPDFTGCDLLPEFSSGLFLPRDDPDWFGRSAFPPRVVALEPEGIRILPHPSALEAPQFLPFERLCWVESGRNLLRGWLRLVGLDFDRTLAYNRRGWKAVDSFLKKPRAGFLHGSSAAAGETATELGESLDLKFQNALSHELDPCEAIRTHLFRAPRQVTRRFLMLKRKVTQPADLLTLTPARLLWITDRENNRYARYGWTTRYAPLARIAGFGRLGDGTALQVAFTPNAPSWQIPVAPEHWSQAVWFEKAFRLPSDWMAVQPGP